MKNLKKTYQGYIFILPALLIFIIFLLYPLYQGVLLAFQEFLFEKTEFVGFKNFHYTFFEDEVFWLAMKNTLLYTLVRVPINIFIALIIATLIFQLKKSQTFFKAAFYLPGVISLVVISMVWRWLFNPVYGLLNQLLSFLKIPPCPWLTSSDTALPSLMLMAILTSPGAAIIIYIAGLQNIPSNYYEAAKIDGASNFAIWRKITIPLLNNTTLYLFVMNTIASFQGFTQVYVMTKGGPGYSTTMLIPLIYFRAFKDFEFGIASAQALILFILIGFVTFLQFKWIKQEEYYQ